MPTVTWFQDLPTPTSKATEPRTLYPSDSYTCCGLMSSMYFHDLKEKDFLMNSGNQLISSLFLTVHPYSGPGPQQLAFPTLELERFEVCAPFLSNAMHFYVNFSLLTGN